MLKKCLYPLWQAFKYILCIHVLQWIETCILLFKFIATKAVLQLFIVILCVIVLLASVDYF